jgi:hypothetical protein
MAAAWLRRSEGRVVEVAPRGRRGLRRTLGVDTA